LPEVVLLKAYRTKLSFDVLDLGRSKVGSVDVYLTADEGATWEKVRPEAIEFPKGEGATGWAEVKVPRDGIIYGFHVVVKNRLGAGKGPPGPGTAPQVRVEVDITAPEALLRMPQPDPKHKGHMLFTWTCNDRNLDPNPVTLEWSEKPGGPWKMIGKPNLSNTGSYSWKVVEKAPVEAYLKMTVRDRAGNVSTAVTPNPVPFELDIPHVGKVRAGPAK
jgi:hypothetical protein